MCTVLSCHIGHGMTRTNQKCNSHLQSMSHATWMFLNVCIVEALRIKTECLAVQFRVQLLHFAIFPEYVCFSLSFKISTISPFTSMKPGDSKFQSSIFLFSFAFQFKTSKATSPTRGSNIKNNSTDFFGIYK